MDLGVNNIVACGCSITHGYYLENSYTDKNHIVRCNKAYPEIVAEKLNADIVNLARPGASNYCIAKQVEYALSLSPDFIIIGLTTSHRFDFTIQRFPEKNWKDNIPSILDYNYSNHGKSTHTRSEGIIDSQPFSAIDSRPGLEEFTDYIVKYIDPDIKRDQDRYIILGMLWRLQRSRIPYIIVDWSNLILEFHATKNVIKDLDWQEFRELYPSDGVHFNQEGHNVAAEAVFSLLKKFILIQKIKKSSL